MRPVLPLRDTPVGVVLRLSAPLHLRAEAQQLLVQLPRQDLPRLPGLRARAGGPWGAAAAGAAPAGKATREVRCLASGSCQSVRCTPLGCQLAAGSDTATGETGWWTASLMLVVMLPMLRVLEPRRNLLLAARAVVSLSTTSAVDGHLRFTLLRHASNGR